MQLEFHRCTKAKIWLSLFQEEFSKESTELRILTKIKNKMKFKNYKILYKLQKDKPIYRT